MFEPLPTEFSFPKAEERVLEFWERQRIFEKSLEQRRGAPRFVFYEGPPTANGLPHPGHCLTRSIKDLFPRYQTMCGKLVERKAGWDTHGLPVEVEVCKELGIHTKEEIEQYGVEKFVRKCIESVFRYTREWEQMTRRLGFWVNLEDAYVTFHQSYVESVWWGLKTLFERGLLYQGHKVVWWWAQGGTALSAGEVGEGYRTVQDPSVYVRFPVVQRGDVASAGYSLAEWSLGSAGVSGALQNAEASGLSRIPAGRPVSLLVWTTTPWTLISNHFAAVGPDVDYALVHDKTTGEYLYIASPLVQSVADKVKHDFEAVGVCKGSDLVGLCYQPPFDCYAKTMADKTAALKDGGEPSVAWRIIPADFIDLATGTGIVHIAPAFGEVDFNLLQDERRRFTDFEAVPLICSVKPDGTMNDEAPPAYRGRWVKDCDQDIIRELKDRGVLLHQETIEHEYPFCPRAEDDPLIQYARKSWFVRTSQFKDEFLKNNAAVNWLPEHIREGRFGDFLRNNLDWALSRERWWGTPLPIWVCEQTGKMEAVGSLAELMDKPGATDRTPEYPEGMWATKKAEDPTIPDHLRVHKPYIDAWTYESPFVDEGIERSRDQGIKGATAVSAVRQRSRMRRVPEVIDCWWDAGSMPFAQWGFPHVTGSVNRFRERFPADFISEAIDQTRGWFYGLLSISTMLFSQTRGVYEHGASFMKACAVHSGTDAPGEWWNLDFDAFVARYGETFSWEDWVRGWDNTGQCGAGKDLDNEDEGLILMARPYPHPYKTCIVLGHVMGEDALKMSKRTKNYKEPAYIFDTYGADAMRWCFFSAQVPWTSTRFVEAGIRDAQREFLVRLYNVFSFFNIYANIDGYESGRDQGIEGSRDRGAGWRPVGQRGELDRWIASELHRTIRFVRESLDRFENYPAAGRLKDFVDALSNWYVRRSRDRFWRGEKDQDKWDAYNTLYEVLLTLSKLLAPFTPFFAETMYQNLTGQRDQGIKGSRDQGEGARGGGSGLDPSIPQSHDPLSVHLCDYPVADETLIDEALAQEMDLVRDIVSLGRAARTAAKLKVRQPLALAEIILARQEHADWLAAHANLIAEELNIKRVEFTTAADHYVTYQVKPEFKAIGPKFGKLAPRVAAALQKLDAAAARQSLTATGELTVEVDGQRVTLTAQEVQVRLEARPGWSAAQGRAGVVVVQTELTAELRDEGLCRELIHCVQALRKEHDLPYEARITLYVQGATVISDLVRRYAATIQQECLATRIECGPPPAGTLTQTHKIEGREVGVALVRA